MRYLILSDVHANIDALEQVLADAARHGAHRVLLLGDLVGYNADPNGVIARIKGLAVEAAVRGNHDRVAAGLGTPANFNAAAVSMAAATSAMLTQESRDYLRRLPPGPIAVSPLVEICHGTPFDEDEYVFDRLDAVNAIQSASRPLCLFGHTHTPFAMRMTGDEAAFPDVSDGSTFRIEEGNRYLVNVGSVGQPRDGDPRAAYGILDTDGPSLTCYRVAYPVERAGARIREAGLPAGLASRLAVGR